MPFQINATGSGSLRLLMQVNPTASEPKRPWPYERRPALSIVA